MKKTNQSSHGNPFVNFFSSIKLAVFLLIALAATSVIGTVIPQGESFQFYLERYGPGMYKLIRTLHLYDTYHSWWYVTLLSLFALNLTVCIGRRLPFTLNLVRRDSLGLGPDKLRRMRINHQWKLGKPLAEVKGELLPLLKEVLGGAREREQEGGVLLLKESGKWSYWGIYLLHASIVIIMLGALVGSFWGKKGNIVLMEGDSTDHFISRGGVGKPGSRVPLGFEVKCERFVVQFYDNGAPKEFRSDLVIYEDGKKVKEKDIRVNDPLEYKGFTFYQSSYQGIPEVLLKFVISDGQEINVSIPAYEQRLLKGVGVAYGIMQFMPQIHGVPAAKIWFGQFRGTPPQAFWLVKGHDREIKIGDKIVKVSMVDAKQKYMTGLQVKKDPGVWIVWVGCLGLILGFIVVFWIPHRRTWIWIGEEEGKGVVILAGQANKGKLAFEETVKELNLRIDTALRERSWV